MKILVLLLTLSITPATIFAKDYTKPTPSALALNCSNSLKNVDGRDQFYYSTINSEYSFGITNTTNSIVCFKLFLIRDSDTKLSKKHILLPGQTIHYHNIEQAEMRLDRNLGNGNEDIQTKTLQSDGYIYSIKGTGNRAKVVRGNKR